MTNEDRNEEELWKHSEDFSARAEAGVGGFDATGGVVRVMTNSMQ